MSNKNNCEVRPDDPIDETPVLFTLDLAGNFKSVDAAAARVFGYEAAEMCRMNIADLVAPDRAPYLRRHIAQGSSEDLGAVYEVDIFTKDGDWLAIEVSTRLVMRNGCPFELKGIALPRVNIWQQRQRCLDEEFWIGPGLSSPRALTFLPTR